MQTDTGRLALDVVSKKQLKQGNPRTCLEGLSGCTRELPPLFLICEAYLSRYSLTLL